MGVDYDIPGVETQGAFAEGHFIQEKKRQAGISFPSARNQDQTLIVRSNLKPGVTQESAREGLRGLCRLFDRIDRGQKMIEKLHDDGTHSLRPLSEFSFSATIGFGSSFCDKLNIRKENRPRKLTPMPENSELCDQLPYVTLR